MSRSTEGLCTHGACSSFRSSEELRCQVFHRRPWLAETSQLGGGTLSLLCPPPTDGLQADKNRRPVVSACLAGVAQLLRLWSRKAHSLRLPADADASCGAETRLACRGIRRVDPRAKPGFCSSGCAFLRGQGIKGLWWPSAQACAICRKKTHPPAGGAMGPSNAREVRSAAEGLSGPILR